MAEVIIENIVKTYEKGTVKALDNVSFSVKSGELFGLIGADGAGKTTLFRILTTLLIPDSGKATVAGFDVGAIQENLTSEDMDIKSLDFSQGRVI